MSCTHGYIKCRLTVLFAGTSNDGHTVTFTSTKLYTESYRFMKDTVLQINGSFINRGDKSVYSGSITLPVNSSFQQFFMVKGKIWLISWEFGTYCILENGQRSIIEDKEILWAENCNYFLTNQLIHLFWVRNKENIFPICTIIINNFTQMFLIRAFIKIAKQFRSAYQKVTRAKNGKLFKQHILQLLAQIENYFTQMFSIRHSTIIAQMIPFCPTKWVSELKTENLLININSWLRRYT